MGPLCSGLSQMPGEPFRPECFLFIPNMLIFVYVSTEGQGWGIGSRNRSSLGAWLVIVYLSLEDEYVELLSN